MNQAGTFFARTIAGLPVWAWGLIIIAGGALAWYLTKHLGSASDQTTTNAGSTAASLPDTIDPLTGVPYSIESAINPNTGLPAYYGVGGTGGSSGGGGGSGGSGTGGSGGDGNNGGSNTGSGVQNIPMSYDAWLAQVDSGDKYGVYGTLAGVLDALNVDVLISPDQRAQLIAMYTSGVHQGGPVTLPAPSPTPQPVSQQTTQAMMAQPFGRNASATTAIPWNTLNGISRAG